MNVLVINIFYYPNMVGGTENSVKLLCEGMVAAGHRVSVYTLDGNNKCLQPEVINGVTVYRGYSKSIRNRLNEEKGGMIDKAVNFFHSFINITANKQIRAIINKEKIDVIHTNNLRSISHWVWKYSEKKGIKLVHTIRDYWLINPKATEDTPRGAINKAFMRYFKNASKKVQIVTAASQCTLSVFEKYGYFCNSKRVVVPNSVEMELEKTINIVHKKTVLNGENIRFLYVGRLTEEKGVKKLLEGFGSVKNSGISLSICGNGPLEEYVNKASQIDTRIKYHGQLNKTELEEKYLNSDVLIVPSIWAEPFGRIIIEGACFGVPTIGSPKGGIPEIIKTLGVGIILEEINSECIANAIQKFTNRDYLSFHIKHIPDNLEYYSLQTQIVRFLSIYNQ